MQVITIGIDLAKDVFQVHGADANDKVVFNKPLRRSQVLPYFAKLPPCLVGMEACASAHYWARELKKLDHDVRLMPAKDVKAYVKRNKNDAVDAAACCRYDNLPRERQLAKAVNDARAMEVALKSEGFESSRLRMWDARLQPGLAATPRCCRAQGEDLSK
jgi:transposase